MSDGNAHRRIFVPFALNPNYDVAWTLAILSEMAYVHNEPALYAPLAQWLGYNVIQWVRTEGSITVNFLIGADDDGVVVAFSGTENTFQIADYAIFTAMVPDANFGFPIGRIHHAFRSQFYKCLDLIEPILALFRSDVSLTFTGHSLGGAVAQIMGLYFVRKNRDRIVNVVTFGAPKIGGPEVAIQLEGDHFLLFRNEGDPVPGLPPSATIVSPGNLPILGDTLVFAYEPARVMLAINDELDVRVKGYNTLTTPRLLYIQSFDRVRPGRFGRIANPPNLGILGTAFSLTAISNSDVSKHRVALYRDRMYRLGIGQRTIVDQDVRIGLIRAIESLKRPSEDVTELTEAQVRQILVRARSFRADAVPPIPAGGITQPTTITNINSSHQTISTGGVSRTTFARSPFIGFPPAPFQLIGQAPTPLGDKRTFWQFRGKDRRMIQLALALLTAMQTRDATLATKGSGHGASNAVPIFDPTNTEVQKALRVLLDNFAVLLFLERVTE